MAVLGKPLNSSLRKYSNISMPKQNLNSPIKKGDILNKISGNKETFRYVDGKKHGALGKDGFLKLLTHQLTHQDPLKPMDQKRFASDLAQFSSLEQLSNMNKKMEKMAANNSAEKKFYGASFLGKVATTKGSTVEFKGEPVDIPFFIKKDARHAVIRVLDDRNQLIRQINLKDIRKGDQTTTWSGLSTSERQSANGIYNIEVIAWDENLGQFRGETRKSGVVTGVRFNGDQVELQLDGKKRIFLRDIESFKILEQNRTVNKNTGRSNMRSALESYNNVERGL